MKIYLVSMMNAFVLMIFGLWGYWGSETPSVTALIPVITGAFLLSLIHGLRYGSKPMANISLILTFLILMAMIMPLTGAIARGDSAAYYRIGFMMFSSTVTVGFLARRVFKVRKKNARIKI